MPDTTEPLIFDLVAWVAKESRPYAEVMEVWRTSCPRLPVWEEANARGLVERRHGQDDLPIVCVTDAGRFFLERRASQ